ncbi:hypothetical protein C6552_27220 [Escherichia coli]|nr:hypothetical protein [Escherichia coli]
MIWQPEFTDKTLSRKPGAVHPVVVYRNSDGSFQCGFVMRSNEVVVSLSLLSEVRELAGLPVDDIQKQL